MTRHNYEEIIKHLKLIKDNVQSTNKFLEDDQIKVAKVYSKGSEKFTDILINYVERIMELEDRYWHQQADLEKEQSNG
jgi:coenzyme F420-reducing hydrogenase delta subunit|tara:strand:- start:803 stop:1036 length:234 start_codon:yes stop_codon:yes gene_type:complete